MINYRLPYMSIEDRIRQMHPWLDEEEGGSKMSEFECANGHLPAPSEIRRNRCPECGAPIVRMDGKSRGRLAYEEREWDKEIEKEKEEREA